MSYKKRYNPCDDCPYSFSKNNQESNVCKICEFKSLLDNQNQVKCGKWLPTKTPSYFGGIIYECSLCGAKDGDRTQILGKYCWRCGAIMSRTPQNDEARE